MSESVLWNEMGNLHMRLGAYEEAISAYGRAIELSPKFGQAYSNLGHAYSSKGKFENAISFFQKSIQLSNSNQEQSITWKRLGDVYQKLGEYEKALAAYRMGDDLDAPNETTPTKLASEPFSFLLTESSNNDLGLKFEPEATDDNEEDDFNLTEAEEIHPAEVETSSAVSDDRLEPFSSYTPPFLPALDIPEDEFQTPEPLQLILESSAQDQNNLTDEPQPVFEEEFGELDDWLQSLDPQVSSDLLVQPATGWEKASSEPRIDLQPRIGAKSTPNKESSFVIPDKDSTLPRLPYRADKDAWRGSSYATTQSQPQQNMILDHEQTSTQVMELEKTNRMELFKSWRLSEAPEHDPDIWKSMIETLEKGKVEDKTISNSLVLPAKLKAEAPPLETPVVNKGCVNRELKDSIDNYRKIAGMAPGNDKAWDTLGKLLKDAGEYAEAVAAFEHAICLCPQKDLYHYHLGLVYAAQKRHDDAILSFQKVIEINPGYTLAHCALAGSYRRLGKEAEADEHIKVALPRLEAETEYNRACFEAICGNTDQAIVLLRLALEKKQTSPDWVRGDPDLDFIRDDPRFKELVGA
jgi:tetratricopeptide (TPR) repeat protein